MKVQVLFIATKHVQCQVDVVTVFLSNDIYCCFLEEFALNNGGLDFGPEQFTGCFLPRSNVYLGAEDGFSPKERASEEALLSESN